MIVKDPDMIDLKRQHVESRHTNSIFRENTWLKIVLLQPFYNQYWVNTVTFTE